MNCLASTGLPVAIWVIVGVLVVGAGFAAWYLSRRSHRRRSSLLGLVLILGLGASALATTDAPAAQAVSTRSCVAGAAAAGTSTPSTSGQPTTSNSTAPTSTGTPQPSSTPVPAARVDLTLVVSAVPPMVNDGTTVDLTYSIRLENLGVDNTTGPVTLRIPKVRQSTTTPVVTSANWSLDSVSDPANYVLTFTPIIAGGGMSPICDVHFRWSPFGSSIRLPATIDTGSAGDTNPTNNSASTVISVGAPALTGNTDPSQ